MFDQRLWTHTKGSLRHRACLPPTQLSPLAPALHLFHTLPFPYYLKVNSRHYIIPFINTFFTTHNSHNAIITPKMNCSSRPHESCPVLFCCLLNAGPLLFFPACLNLSLHRPTPLRHTAQVAVWYLTTRPLGFLQAECSPEPAPQPDPDLQL